MSSVGTTESALAIGYTFPIIGGILVALRFYTRHQQKSGYKLDDWVVLLAWLCVLGSSISILLGVYRGIFVPAPVDGPNAVTPQERLVAQITAASVIFWIFGNYFVKTTLILFCRRIFVGRLFNIFSRVLLGLSALWLVYSILTWLLYCGAHVKENFEGGWLACDPWGFDLQMATFVFDNVIDFLIILLPVPMVWRLQLDWQRKLLVTVVFLLGGFAFIAGVFNTIIQLTYLLNPAVTEGDSGNNFFQGASLLFTNWPAIEIGVGLIACNLPTLSPQVLTTFPSLFKRGWGLSMSGFRSVAALIRSGNHSSKRSVNRSNINATGDEQGRSDADITRHGSEQTNIHAGIKKSGGSHSGSHLSTDEEADQILLDDLNVRQLGADSITARGHQEGYQV